MFWSREKGYKLFRITKEERERDRLEGISNIKLYYVKGCLCLTRPEELERGMIRRVTPSWQNAVAHCMVLIHICTFLMMEDV